MIEKYYAGAIEQIISGIGTKGYNGLLVRYSGDFSVKELDAVRKVAEEKENLFFEVCEFDYHVNAASYEPYLSIICQMFRRYMTGSFEEFMEQCDVYELHRSSLLSYFETGICEREEMVLLDEVEYEQRRMASALENMLLQLSKKCPVVIVMNRFQYASRSTMVLTNRLLNHEYENIGICIGVNDIQAIPEFLQPEWETILEKMDDASCVVHIGNSGKKKEAVELDGEEDYFNEAEYQKISNMVSLLDFEQAAYLLGKLERRIKFENLTVAAKRRYQLSVLYAKASILLGNIPKALEICEDLRQIHLEGEEDQCRFMHEYLMTLAYMYQGKLPEAMDCAKSAWQYGKNMKDDYSMFLAELLEAQVQMSGWYNIFFCAQDVKVSDALIEKMGLYNYKNHLAHVYIYAYDNKPEIVAKAYRSEELLRYFSKGIRIAKELGNEQLLISAYTKNIMLASTNGMYEIALLYSLRSYEVLKIPDSIEGGRIYSGIAYNLCAMGQNERAEKYYIHAIRLLYHLRKPEEIAEVQYNMALNAIMGGDYAKAESNLTQCMKAIEKLNLNSLRVCNLSKLYSLLALVSILLGNRFNCERYLINCGQFLSYVLERDKMENTLSVVHDYAQIDDDMFLYSFSQALLAYHDGELEKALEMYEKADEYLKRAEGNLFFSVALFRRSRMECFETVGEMRLYEKEQEALQQYEESHLSTFGGLVEDIIKRLPPVDDEDAKTIQKATDKVVVSLQSLDELLWQESMVVSYNSKRQQLDFISTWQKAIDVTGVGAEEMMDTVMKTFLNHFNVDCAVYVRYTDRQPKVLYNNTGKTLHPDAIEQIEHSLRQNASGFVTSKTSSDYVEHQDITSIFGVEDVCSMIAIPFFDKAKIESFLIVYIRMKDNWHSNLNRYMFNEDDLNIFQLLFREVCYSLNRIDAYDKIYEMNTKLYLSAVTDQLTGIYNREGFYQKLKSLLTEFAQGRKKAELGLMFIDLDNFKPYNDTFGHDVGDLILKEMADIFQDISQGRGFVCRYGGDEFIIVLYTAEKQTVEELAKEIYRRIEQADGFEKPIAQKLGKEIHIGESERISCSIGIVTEKGIKDEEHINRLIKQADDLLYMIKTSTKGTYRI